jgi:hypothetical protein
LDKGVYGIMQKDFLLVIDTFARIFGIDTRQAIGREDEKERDKNDSNAAKNTINNEQSFFCHHFAPFYTTQV